MKNNSGTFSRIPFFRTAAPFFVVALLLAFDAFAFSRATGKLPAIAKIVHGHRYSTVKVGLGKLYGKVRRVIEKMELERSESASPPVVLNRHCAEWQFQAQCHQIAREKDDLSLLSTISDKERKKCHEKGIFTVTPIPMRSDQGRVRWPECQSTFLH